MKKLYLCAAQDPSLTLEDDARKRNFCYSLLSTPGKYIILYFQLRKVRLFWRLPLRNFLLPRWKLRTRGWIFRALRCLMDILRLRWLRP